MKIMRVICNSNSGKSISNRYLNLGFNVNSIFSVLIGKEYEVFAMSLWSQALFILLADENHLPSWFPLDLFSLSNPDLPGGWSFSSDLDNANGLQALWGYERLITDTSHYDGLLERDPEALRHFYEEERLHIDSGDHLPQEKMPS
ncbi:MAG: hypothetical protein P4L87_18965 [Formivibrio sp.]|nr:hypothetical protein [Formivibrio sp.]